MKECRPMGVPQDHVAWYNQEQSEGIEMQGPRAPRVGAPSPPPTPPQGVSVSVPWVEPPPNRRSSRPSPQRRDEGLSRTSLRRRAACLMP